MPVCWLLSLRIYVLLRKWLFGKKKVYWSRSLTVCMSHWNIMNIVGCCFAVALLIICTSFYLRLHRRTYAEAIWMKYIKTYCNTVCTEMEGMIVYFLPVIWPVWLFRWRKGSVFLPCKLFTSIIKSFKPSQQNSQRILKKRNLFSFSSL